LPFVDRCERIGLAVNEHVFFRRWIAGSLAAAFLLALGLAASPEWHARFHPDADSPTHECAVTLIAAGKVEQASSPPLLVALPCVLILETIPVFAPVRLPAPFLSAAIFEHAPPALS
jgi:hypothetical protein